MLPATKRGRSNVEKLSATSRATRAAARLISTTASPSPYSASVSRLARKLSVSTTSQPTSRKAAWMSRMTSGRDRARWSLQPCSAGPPKSSAESPSAWMLVPIAPS